jgi:hypothetical protein
LVGPSGAASGEPVLEPSIGPDASGGRDELKPQPTQPSATVVNHLALVGAHVWPSTRQADDGSPPMSTRLTTTM